MKHKTVPLNMIIDLGHDMRGFIALHTDEELIRLGRRAVNAKMEGLAAMLAKEIAERDQNETILSKLYGPLK
jgi:hypothetical protein